MKKHIELTEYEKLLADDWCELNSWNVPEKYRKEVERKDPYTTGLAMKKIENSIGIEKCLAWWNDPGRKNRNMAAPTAIDKFKDLESQLAAKDEIIEVAKQGLLIASGALQVRGIDEVHDAINKTLAEIEQLEQRPTP